MRKFDYPGFSVEQVEPKALAPDQLIDRAQAIQEVTYAAWRQKFGIPDEDLRTKINPYSRRLRDVQADKIAHPSRHARYWVSYGRFDQPRTMTQAAGASGMLRVETYNPRNPFVRSYPNVTDLEVANGQIHGGEYENQAAALLYLALGDFSDKRKLAVWIVDGDSDSTGWLEDLSFVQTDSRNSEMLGNTKVDYRHMEAPTVGAVRAQLLGQYPVLAVRSEA